MVASWMPSSPEECTETPTWNVSHTRRPSRTARIPPQNVVSSRITSALRRQNVGRELLEVDHDRVGGERYPDPIAYLAHPSSPNTGSSR